MCPFIIRSMFTLRRPGMFIIPIMLRRFMFAALLRFIGVIGITVAFTLAATA